MEEEGVVIVGMLVGLNVIDANLCVKGEDLDTQVKHITIQTMLSDDTDAKHVFLFLQVGVIDFSMYLKDLQATENAQEWVCCHLAKIKH